MAYTMSNFTSPNAGVVVSNAGNETSTTTADGQAIQNIDQNAVKNPMSASGDIIYGGASGTPTRLPKDSDGKVLTLASGLPSWATAVSGASTQTFLGSDVTLNNTATYFSVVNTGSIGANGQQLRITAHVQIDDTAGAANFIVEITDGSTTFVSTHGYVPAASASTGVDLMCDVSPSAAATYTLKVRDSTSTSGKAETSSGGNAANKATWIEWTRTA